MPTKSEFRQRLVSFSSQIDDNPVPSSHKTLRDDIDNNARQSADFWTTPPSGTDWRKPRTIAYLCAYVETFGAEFPSGPAPLDDGGVVVADVSVMKALLQAGCIGLSDDRQMFRLTGKGQALVEPFVHLEYEVSP